MSKKAQHELAKLEDGFEFDHDEYSKVSCAAALREIKLIQSDYLLKPEGVLLMSDPEKLNLSYGGDCSFLNYDEDDCTAVSQFEWRAEVKHGRKRCVRLRAAYILIYAGFDNCDPKHVGLFISKIGRFATYPYFRSHFSHHISESGIVMAPLPTLNERVD